MNHRLLSANFQSVKSNWKQTEHKINKQNVGFEILIPVVMKNSVFYDITPRSPLRANGHFGGTCRLHLQGRRISQARNQREYMWQAQLWSGLLFDREDRNDMFLWKVGWISTDYTVLWPRRQNTSNKNNVYMASTKWRYVTQYSYVYLYICIYFLIWLCLHKPLCWHPSLVPTDYIRGRSII
jgi:hypothetical protein